MRLTFMGTPAFALPSLKALIASNHTLDAIYCQPDKPAGRHLPVLAPPIACEAKESGIPLFQPKTLRKSEVQDELRAIGSEVIVVVAYGKILPEEVLGIPPQGCVNLHPSLLPKYRGASPIQSALAAGETITGITTMFMDKGMDTGPLLLQRKWAITEEDTSETLHTKLSEAGADLLVETLNELESGSLVPIPQNESEASICYPLSREDGLIQWELPAMTIYNRFRAFIPWPGSYTFFRGKNFKVHWLVPLPDSSDAPPGTILSSGREGIRVAAGRGCVVITHVQLEGKRRVSARDFSLGIHIESGERFTCRP